VLAVYEGMGVELTERLGGVLKNTQGVVEHVLLHAKEDMAWAADDSPALRSGEVVLRYLPSLLVRVAGYGRPRMFLRFLQNRVESGQPRASGGTLGSGVSHHHRSTFPNQVFQTQGGGCESQSLRISSFSAAS
jgi:hypothetical protein